MIKFNNSLQITINEQQRLGSHEKQPLLFSLVHLILFSPMLSIDVYNQAYWMKIVRGHSMRKVSHSRYEESMHDL